MPTDTERDKAFERARDLELKRIAELNADTLKEVKGILDTAEDQINTILMDTPSEFTEFHFTSIRQSITAEMRELGEALGQATSARAVTAFTLGQELIDNPILAGGVNIAALLPEIDPRSLLAIRTFLIHKMGETTLKTAGAIRENFGLVIGGVRSRSEAVTVTQKLLQVNRSKANTVTNTEIGRAYSVATHERQMMASAYLPGLMKQWRRSMKEHERPAHTIADGQLVAVEKKFVINGARLDHPRDPKGPAKETINCGCISLPKMEGWEVRNPDRQSFTDEELRRNPFKRELTGAFISENNRIIR
jgi:hypothetical protein